MKDGPKARPSAFPDRSRRHVTVPTRLLRGPERTHGSRTLRFPNAAGELLAARLERPSQEPIAYALFAHCFTCDKDSLAARRIAEALTARGIAVLRFDFTGLG